VLHHGGTVRPLPYPVQCAGEQIKRPLQPPRCHTVLYKSTVQGELQHLIPAHQLSQSGVNSETVDFRAFLDDQSAASKPHSMRHTHSTIESTFTVSSPTLSCKGFFRTRKSCVYINKVIKAFQQARSWCVYWLRGVCVTARTLVQRLGTEQ